MALFRRDKGGASPQERAELTSHLEELRALRAERLRDLGDRALTMHRRNSYDRDQLFGAAREVAAIESEAKLVERGLDENLTLEELAALADKPDPAAADADGDGS